MRFFSGWRIRPSLLGQSATRRFRSYLALARPTHNAVLRADGWNSDQQNLSPRQGFQEWLALPDFSLACAPQSRALRQTMGIHFQLQGPPPPILVGRKSIGCS